jgi:hypothetical protein
MSTFILGLIIFGSAFGIVYRRVKRGFGQGCNDCTSSHCPVKEVEKKETV